MTSPAPTYDLVLLLDPQAEQDARDKIVADTRSSITSGGELLRHDEWGERALSYPIEHRTSARYHLLQFHAGSNDLLSGLDRTLRLADEVLRFRIIKLAPGVPSAPDMSASAPPPPRQAEGETTPQPPAPSEPAPPEAELAPSPSAEGEAAEGEAAEGETPAALAEPS